MNSINENGCSVCQPSKENYTTYATKLGRKKVRMYQYDYRTESGELFYGKKIIMESQRLIIPCNQLDIPITLHFGFP